MKSLSRVSIATLGIAFMAACTPSPTALQKTMEEHPEIIFAAIEKNPDKFFEVVEKAGQQAREKQQAGQFDRELDRVKEELKKPAEVTVADNRIVGKADAIVTVVEYSDYNCGHCGDAHKTMDALKAKYGDKVKFVFKHLPILAPTSRAAAELVEAVRLQDPDKAFALHEELFSSQGDLREGGEKFLKAALKKVGADVGKAEKDRKNPKVKETIDADIAEARKYEFSGTPGFLVNGAAIRGAYPQPFFEQVIDMILASSASAQK